MTPASLKVGLSELDYRAKLMPLVEGSARSVTFDAVQRRRNGTVYPIKVHVWRIRGPSSELFAEVSIATADQRKAFGLLEQVFDAIPGGIGVFDNRSRLLMANRRLYDLMNIPPELFPPVRGSRISCATMRAAANGAMAIRKRWCASVSNRRRSACPTASSGNARAARC